MGNGGAKKLNFPFNRRNPRSGGSSGSSLGVDGLGIKDYWIEDYLASLSLRA
jgi:hypothetical protein